MLSTSVFYQKKYCVIRSFLTKNLSINELLKLFSHFPKKKLVCKSFNVFISIDHFFTLVMNVTKNVGGPNNMKWIKIFIERNIT